MDSKRYLLAAKSRLGNCSDYALAKHLGLSRSAMSLLINGHTAMSATTAIKISEILGIHWQEIVADAERDRGVRGADKDLWQRVAKKVAFLAGAGAGAALLYQAMTSGGDPQLAALAFVSVESSSSVIMLNPQSVVLAGFAVLTAIAALAFSRVPARTWRLA